MILVLLQIIFGFMASTAHAEKSNSTEFKIMGPGGGRSCPPEDLVFESPAPDIIACSGLCWMTPGCLTVSFNVHVSTCQGCDVRFFEFVTNTSAAGGTLFAEEGKVYPEGYIEIGGMIVKLVNNNWFGYTLAPSACQPYGRLARVDTPKKISALMDHINKTYGERIFKEAHYWVQGVYDAVYDIWRYSDGAPFTDIMEGYFRRARWFDGQNCCTLSLRGLYGWYCHKKISYICEYYNAI